MLDGLFKGLFGQTDIPSYQPIDIGSAIGDAGQYSPAAAGVTTNFTKLIEDGYDPNQRALRLTTTQSLLDDLNLGGALPDDVRQAVTQSGFERAVRSGTANPETVSQAGFAGMARDLGLTSLDLRNQRLSRAQQAVGDDPGTIATIANQGVTPSDIAGANITNTQSQNNFNIWKAAVEAQNSKNTADTLFQGAGLASGLFGAAFGDPDGSDDLSKRMSRIQGSFTGK